MSSEPINLRSGTEPAERVDRLSTTSFKREKGDVSHTVALALHVLTACNMSTFWGVNNPDYAQSISNCKQDTPCRPNLATRAFGYRRAAVTVIAPGSASVAPDRSAA